MLILSENSIDHIFITTQVSFYKLIEFIDGTFLNSIPVSIKGMLALIILSAFAFLCLFLFCFTVGVVYHFIIAILNCNKNEAISCKFKKSLAFVLDKINHPVENGVFGVNLRKTITIISLLVIITPCWKIILPFFTLSFFLNERISKLIKFRVNGWLFLFLVIMSFIPLILFYFDLQWF